MSKFHFRIKNNQNGFTLVEIMICIMLLGMFSMSILQMQVKTVQTNTSAVGITEAALVLSGVKENLISSDFDTLVNGNTYPVTADVGTPEVPVVYTTQYTVTDIEISGPDDVYKQIDLTTSWQEGNRTRSIQGQMFLLDKSVSQNSYY